VQAALEKVCHPVIQQKVQPCPRRECWEVQMFPPPVPYPKHRSKTSLYKTGNLEGTNRKNAETNEKRATRENGTNVTQEHKQQQRY